MKEASQRGSVKPNRVRQGSGSSRHRTSPSAINRRQRRQPGERVHGQIDIVDINPHARHSTYSRSLCTPCYFQTLTTAALGVLVVRATGERLLAERGREHRNSPRSA